jgi:hypothetical protein
MTGSDLAQGGSRPSDRAQTLPDFAVAIAVFLLTIVFVSVFVPQLTLPFDDQERPVVADRIAADLGDDLGAGNESRSELDESATRDFFAQTESEALAQFGVDSWYSLNVTLRNASSYDGRSEIRCANADSGWWLVECDAGDQRLALGSSPPAEDRSVATVRRALFAVDRTGAQHRTEYVVLEVRVW